MSDSKGDPRRRHSAKVVDGPGKSASRAMLPHMSTAICSRSASDFSGKARARLASANR